MLMKINTENPENVKGNKTPWEVMKCTVMIMTQA